MVDTPGTQPPPGGADQSLLPSTVAAEARRDRFGRLGPMLRVVVLVVAVAAAVTGGINLVAASHADDRAVAARDRAARARVRRRGVERATEAANHAADGPIGIAERVSSARCRRSVARAGP